MLVAALAVTWATPATTAWAEDDLDGIADVDLLEDEMCCLGGGGSGKSSSPAANGVTINKASAYSNLSWYQQTQSTTNMGRAKNKIIPNTSATGDHVVYKANTTTNTVTNYAVFKVNPKNPTGFDEALRYDGVGTPHTNPVTGEILLPHVHDKSALGGIRSPYLNEKP